MLSDQAERDRRVIEQLNKSNAALRTRVEDFHRVVCCYANLPDGFIEEEPGRMARAALADLYDSTQKAKGAN